MWYYFKELFGGILSLMLSLIAHWSLPGWLLEFSQRESVMVYVALASLEQQKEEKTKKKRMKENAQERKVVSASSKQALSISSLYSHC